MKYAVLLLCIFITHTITQAQIRIDTTKSAEYLIDTVLAGNGARIGNVKLTGARRGIAYVDFSKDIIGIDKGILISTGNAIQAEGPNQSPSMSGLNSNPNIKNYDDPYLSKLAGFPTYDVMVLEFDFVPYNNKVLFHYCFASEEYIEYVDSKFNDVFAFIISSEGAPSYNMAVVPETNDIVSVNTINHKKNNSFYQNNTLFDQPNILQVFRKVDKKTKKMLIDSISYLPGTTSKANIDLLNTLEFDGMTTLLTAEAFVVPYKKYHLRICIADVGDPHLDSGVFLEGSSFTSEKDTTQPGFVPYEAITDEWKADSILGVSVGERVIVKQEIVVKDTTPPRRSEGKPLLKDIFFDSDKYNLSAESRTYLNQLALYLIDNNVRCVLEGNADNSGSHEHNTWLSEQRAK